MNFRQKWTYKSGEKLIYGTKVADSTQLSIIASAIRNKPSRVKDPLIRAYYESYLIACRRGKLVYTK